LTFHFRRIHSESAAAAILRNVSKIGGMFI
jgi:hypothetical protein